MSLFYSLNGDYRSLFHSLFGDFSLFGDLFGEHFGEHFGEQHDISNRQPHHRLFSDIFRIFLVLITSNRNPI